VLALLVLLLLLLVLVLLLLALVLLLLQALFLRHNTPRAQLQLTEALLFKKRMRQ
jgi:hypothetical protein